MKICITGAKGYIGRALSSKLALAHEVSGVDLDALDLLDGEAFHEFLERGQYDVLVHCANYAVLRCHKPTPGACLENNLRMGLNVLQGARHVGRVLMFGSGAQYDRSAAPPFVREEYLGHSLPRDEYGLSKLIMSRLAESQTNVFEMILFGVFGPGEDWRVRFISNACCRALAGMPITVNKNVRFDYLWIEDLCALVSRFIVDPPEVRRFNVGSGSPVDLVSLAREIRQVTGANVPIHIAQEGMGNEYSGDTGRLRGWARDFEFTQRRESLPLLAAHLNADATWRQDLSSLLFDSPKPPYHSTE